LYASVEEKAADESYVPPEGAQKAAQAALAARAAAAPSNRGMTAVGLARARQLANGQRVSLATIRRMVAYFDRHEVDNAGSTWDAKGKGWQAWHGWGGDAGRAWAESVLKKHESVKSFVVTEKHLRGKHNQANHAGRATRRRAKKAAYAKARAGGASAAEARAAAVAAGNEAATRVAERAQRMGAKRGGKGMAQGGGAAAAEQGYRIDKNGRTIVNGEVMPKDEDVNNALFHAIDLEKTRREIAYSEGNQSRKQEELDAINKKINDAWATHEELKMRAARTRVALRAMPVVREKMEDEDAVLYALGALERMRKETTDTASATFYNLVHSGLTPSLQKVDQEKLQSIRKRIETMYMGKAKRKDLEQLWAEYADLLYSAGLRTTNSNKWRNEAKRAGLSSEFDRFAGDFPDLFN
jgi:hypothetical protein